MNDKTLDEFIKRLEENILNVVFKKSGIERETQREGHNKGEMSVEGVSGCWV